VRKRDALLETRAHGDSGKNNGEFMGIVSFFHTEMNSVLSHFFQKFMVWANVQ
jgi:hypothetical protein